MSLLNKFIRINDCNLPLKNNDIDFAVYRNFSLELPDETALNELLQIGVSCFIILS